MMGMFFAVSRNNSRSIVGLKKSWLIFCVWLLISSSRGLFRSFICDASSLNNIIYEYKFDKNPGQCENHCWTQMSTKRQTRMGSFILEGFHRIEIENVVREPLWEKSLRKFRLKGNADGNWLWIFWLGLHPHLIKNSDYCAIVCSHFSFSHIWR